jgi:tight adherence protein B
VIWTTFALLGVDLTGRIVTSLALLVLGGIVGGVGYRPARELIARQEQMFDSVLRRALLIDVSPRVATMTTLAALLAAGLLVLLATGSLTGMVLVMGLGAFVPSILLKYLRGKRIAKLEEQLVPAIQSLSAGVRAGLNLVQAMELIARDNPNPIRQEFAHLLREYEYGTPLEKAMNNAADRIGSGDFRLLFSALLTHRQRGGDLGQTLDRICQSIREIQRLEKRVETLTAQGRATARWLGAMPLIVVGVLYLIEPGYAHTLMTDPVGKGIILVILLCNLVGFLWIRKIMSIDI